MSTLSSSSSLSDVHAAYLDNASYREDGDPGKAAAFVTACRILLLLTPTSAAQQHTSLSLDVGQIQKELQKAESWLATSSQNTAGGVKHLSTEYFRD